MKRIPAVSRMAALPAVAAATVAVLCVLLLVVDGVMGGDSLAPSRPDGEHSDRVPALAPAGESSRNDGSGSGGTGGAVHIVAMASTDDGHFQALRHSVARAGIKMDLIGWGMAWTGFSMKPQLLLQYLERLPDDDIVVQVDGYDVIMTLPDLHELRRRFDAMQCDVLLSLQNLVDVVEWFMNRRLFGGCNGLVFNAGAYMGRVRYMKELMHHMLAAGSTDSSADDQMILNTVICSETDWSSAHVAVDVNSTVFFTEWRTATSGGNPNVRINYDTGVITLPHSDYQPIFVHGANHVNLTELAIAQGLPHDKPPRPYMSPAKTLHYMMMLWPEILFLTSVVLSVPVGGVYCWRRRRAAMLRLSVLPSGKDGPGQEGDKAV